MSGIEPIRWAQKKSYVSVCLLLLINKRETNRGEEECCPIKEKYWVEIRVGKIEGMKNFKRQY